MIRLQNITKSFGQKPVLNGLDLEVKRGSCVGLVGENGSGKSTLLTIMAGAQKRDGGDIFYNELKMESTQQMARYVAYVPQENPLIEELSVYDNLRLWYAGTGKDLKLALKQGLPHEMGIDRYLNAKVKNLSGGMKKRLSIASALANEAMILLLDEPGASLDLLGKNDIWTYVRAYVKQGGTVILSSHEMEELHLCDTLYLMENGTLHAVPAHTGAYDLVTLLEKSERKNHE